MQSLALCQQVLQQINQVIIGKEHQVKLALCCLLAKGHLLIEDLPGMGKTTLSHAIAETLGLSYRRIQFTADLLPADVIGVSIFKQAEHCFEFHPGPVFSQLVLADEINRASPKTQSALLEAMEERQVSVDGHTHPLPLPFFVIATQNPFHQSGTFPLPESQLDRFLMRITLGFPSVAAEKQMLLQDQKLAPKTLKPLLTLAQLTQLQESVGQVTASDALLNYLLALVNESRKNGAFSASLSPRATKSLLQASKAWAFMQDRDYVIPDDIKAVFAAVAEHRLTNSHTVGETHLADKLLALVEPL